MNYVEGTRFNTQKQQRSGVGYQHVLQPAGGIAYTLAAMGEQFEHIIDVTLAYPDNRQQPFRDLLMGRMQRIVVHIDLLNWMNRYKVITSTINSLSVSFSFG